MRQFIRVRSVDYEEVHNDSGRFVLGPSGRVIERELHHSYFTLQGGVLILRTKSRGKVGGGRRGKVWGFSHASRARLIRLLNTIDSEASVFVTLTYPGEFDNGLAKLHLKRFANWFRNRFPSASFFWKLEYQRRGAAHYHLIVWGVDCDSDFRSLIAHAWYKIVGSNDQRHLSAGTQCDVPNGPWRFYLSKYISKVDDYETVGHTGRIWGFHNKSALSFFPVRYSVVSAEVYDSLKAFNGDSSARCHNPDELEALNQYLDSILL